MLSTDYTPGTPRWLDLGSPDVAATDAFYTSLFGWEKEDAGPEAGGYGFYKAAGKRIGGVGPLMDPSATPAWTIYFGTDDAEATAKAVELAGGKVRVPVSDVMGFGRMAAFTDPQGGEFAVWQPQLTKGFEIVNVPVSLSWTELHTADAEGARGFYTTVLDWTLTDNDMGDFTYTVASKGGDESSFGGLMGHFPGETVTFWLPYFEVADCDATVAKATELGGTIQMGPATMEGVGRMASVRDPHGSIFSVIASLQPS